MTHSRNILTMVTMAAVLAVGVAMPSIGAAAGNCLSDQQIQAAIASGEIKSWPQVKKLAQIPGDYQEVSDVRVCLVNGVPFYTVNLVSPSGGAEKMVVNAVNGSH